MNLLLVLLFLILLSPQQKTAHRILDPFNSNWHGEFKIYNFHGELIDKLEVEQRYSWKGEEQHGVFVERYRNGKVVHARARNYEKDGRLVCEVEKDNGERTEHWGRFEEGALFWYRQTPDGKITESFKERVIKTGAGREYQIDGLGIYKSENGALILQFAESRRLACLSSTMTRKAYGPGSSGKRKQKSCAWLFERAASKLFIRTVSDIE